jgi:hypothetical protein
MTCTREQMQRVTTPITFQAMCSGLIDGRSQVPHFARLERTMRTFARTAHRFLCSIYPRSSTRGD